MKTLRDFFTEHPDKDDGLIASSYTSCQGRRDKDIYTMFKHTEGCAFCREWMRNRDNMAKRLKPSNADRQRVVEQMARREKMMFSNSQPVT